MRQKLPLLQQENDDLRQTCMQLARQAGVNPNQISLLKTGGGGGGGGGGYFGNGRGNPNDLRLRRSSVPALPTQAAGGGGGGGFSGGSGHLPAPPPRRPAPSPFISPTTSHGNGMDSFTPVHTSIQQRQALLDSGSRPQLGATLLRGGSGGGGSGGGAIVRARRVSGASGGASGRMTPPGVRLSMSHNIEDVNPNTRHRSSVPMGLPPHPPYHQNHQNQHQHQQHDLGLW